MFSWNAHPICLTEQSRGIEDSSSLTGWLLNLWGNNTFWLQSNHFNALTECWPVLILQSKNLKLKTCLETASCFSYSHQLKAVVTFNWVHHTQLLKHTARGLLFILLFAFLLFFFGVASFLCLFSSFFFPFHRPKVMCVVSFWGTVEQTCS